MRLGERVFVGGEGDTVGDVVEELKVVEVEVWKINSERGVVEVGSCALNVGENVTWLEGIF